MEPPQPAARGLFYSHAKEIAMQITIHANALHIHMGAEQRHSMGDALAEALLQDAEQPDPLPASGDEAKADDLNAPLTEQDLREVAPFFVAALQHILGRRQQKNPTGMHS